MFFDIYIGAIIILIIVFRKRFLIFADFFLISRSTACILTYIISYIVNIGI